MLLRHVNDLSDATYNERASHYQTRIKWMLQKQHGQKPEGHYGFRALRSVPFYDRSSPPPESADDPVCKEQDKLTPVNNLPDVCNDDTWFINLSKTKLTNEAVNLLKMGFKFSVDSYPFDPSSFILPIEKALNKLNNQVETNIYRTVWTNQIKKYYNKCNNRAYKRNAEILNTIKKCKDVILLNADKGNTTILMDKSEYNNKMIDYLNDDTLFQNLTGDPTNQVKNLINRQLKMLKTDQCIDNDFYINCVPSSRSSAPTVFGQVKIHKMDKPLRPIVNTKNNPTRNLADMLVKVLASFKPFCIHTVRNTMEFIKNIEDIKMTYNDKMASFDVVSMFNSLKHDYVIKALEYFAVNFDVNLPFSVETLIELTKLVLDNSYCRYGKAYYKQMQGLAMGSSLSPILADITMAYFEINVIDNRRMKPTIWLRYVDDVFLIWKHTNRQLKVFHNSINQAVPGIQFTLETECDNTINFLDLTIQKYGERLKTKIYRKTTFSGRYLNYNSNHSASVKKGIATNLFRRAINYTTEKTDLEIEIGYIKNILKLNNYPDSVISKTLYWAKQKIQPKLPRDHKNGIYLDYVKGLSEQIASFLRDAGFDVTYRTIGTLASLYYSQLYNDNILEHEGCVYVIECHCGGIYIGETKRKLKTRLAEHQRFLNEKYRGDPDLKFHSAVAFHATTNNHQIQWNEVKILTKEKNDYKRKIKEAFFIKMLRPSLNLNEGTNIPPQWFFVLRQSLLERGNASHIDKITNIDCNRL